MDDATLSARPGRSFGTCGKSMSAQARSGVAVVEPRLQLDVPGVTSVQYKGRGRTVLSPPRLRTRSTTGKDSLNVDCPVIVGCVTVACRTSGTVASMNALSSAQSRARAP